MDGHVESADGPPAAPHRSAVTQANGSSVGGHSPPTSDRARYASGILGEAAELAKARFDRGIFDVATKDDGSPVTRADRDVESLLRRRLAELFPEDGILGEEFPEREGSSGNRWIIDPIDGTRSFIRGIPLYATLMAYERQDTIVFGAIALPSLSQTVYAETGAGCWVNDKPAHVSPTKELRGAHVMATWLEDWDLALLTRMRRDGVILRTWGDAYGYALVATGQADAMVDHTVGVYDLGPMPVILEEAGGQFTSKAGIRAIDRGNAVASNGIIHDSVLALLKEG